MKNRKHRYLGTSMERAFKTILALQREDGVTVRELADYLEFESVSAGTRYKSSMRWIDTASLFVPVIELENRRYSFGAACDINNHRSSGGSTAIVYGIME